MVSQKPRDFSANPYDIAIVGGGTIGLGAAYAATKRGLKTVIIDKYDIPNQLGSSRGLERIFRVMYAQENRAKLAQDAYKMWLDIQQVGSVEILIQDSLLFFGYKDAPPTPEGNLLDIKNTMDKLKIPYEYLDSPEKISNRFPIFNPKGMPSDYIGLVQSTMSASIDVAKATITLLNLAEKTGLLSVYAGAEIISATPPVASSQNTLSYSPWVLQIKQNSNGVSSAGTINAKSLILAPGVWAGSLLGAIPPQRLKQSDAFRIWQMTLAYWKKKTAEHIPLWYEFGNTKDNNNGLFYGFPELNLSSDTKGFAKISADYAYNRTIYKTPSEITGEPDPQIISDISKHITNLFNPGTFYLDHYTSQKTCLYSMSGDSKMVIGGIPVGDVGVHRYPYAAMSIMASGRAFKFTPVFGEILVDIALTDGTSIPPNWGTPYDDLIAEFTPFRPGVFEPWTDRS